MVFGWPKMIFVGRSNSVTVPSHAERPGLPEVVSGVTGFEETSQVPRNGDGAGRPLRQDE
jgi:hypothetical protein